MATKKIIVPEQNPEMLPDDDFFNACQDGESSCNAWVPDEEDIEGIGAEDLAPVSDYTPRLTVPSKTDKN